MATLQQIRDKVTGRSREGQETTTLYHFIKELHCLPDVIGREFEVDYDDKGRISRIRQLPMSIPSLNTLLKEMEKDYQHQKREHEKMKAKSRSRRR